MAKLEHLELPRIELDQARRTNTYVPPERPRDREQHVRRLEAETDAAVEIGRGLHGFDPRYLLTIEAPGVDPSELAKLGGFSVVSQEGKKLSLVFGDDAQIKAFKRRLGQVMEGETPNLRDIVFAIDRVGTWGEADRKGPAIMSEGEPRSPSRRFLLDVELWPRELRYEIDGMVAAFERWCRDNGIEILDKIVRSGLLLLLRVDCDDSGYRALLRHRDVRAVDYPPRYAVVEQAHAMSMNAIGRVPTAPTDAPRIAVLDTGINAGHPLLQPAVSGAESFVQGAGPEDDHGHGTAVAGLAAYYDVHGCAAALEFEPAVRVHGARVVDAAGHAKGELLENVVERVVKKLRPQGIRIFNLSICNIRKPYAGGHVAGLARVLDELSRRHDVLFVVPTGNYEGDDDPPRWLADYPRYLLDKPDARLSDPAPAINVLTVGSLARHESPGGTSTNVAIRPVARRGQPSPFSRSGPGSNGAVKPDLADFGGNYVINRAAAANEPLSRGVGELSLRHDIDKGLVVDRIGTSLASPKVAHVAARVLAARPGASMSLIRALVVGSCSVPGSTMDLSLGDSDVRRLVGYGQPSIERACDSSERRVTLLAEATIGENQTQFFEVPLVASFMNGGTRERSITVALAHCPAVRSTRIEYRASRFAFRLVGASSLSELKAIFKKTSKADRLDLLKEVRRAVPNQTTRSAGTVQCSRYEIKRLSALANQHLYLVVTRTVPKWAEGIVENEAYAAVVTIEDREAAAATLYTEVQAAVRLRERQRG